MKIVNNVTSGARSSERSLSKTGFCAEHGSGHSNEDGDELREGDKNDRVSHGGGVVLLKLRERVDRCAEMFFDGWQTDCSVPSD